MSGFAIDTLSLILGGSILGGGIPGRQPPGGLLGGGGGTHGGSGMQGGQPRGMDRIRLRRAFNGYRTSYSGTNSNRQPVSRTQSVNAANGVVVSLTPFRRAFNAGDVSNVKNSAPLAFISRCEPGQRAHEFASEHLVWWRP